MVTAPNALCLLRMAGAVVLVALAWRQAAGPFLWLLIAMLITDWIDGKLARLLDQRSAIGPMLDSLADGCTYVAIVLGLWWLRREALWHESPFILAAAVSYLLHVGVALVRFRRLPSYHTRAAKTSWLLIGAGALALFAGGPWWPFRVGLIAVVITNLEAVGITFVLRAYRDDVPSILRAVELRRREANDGSPGAR